MITLYGGRLVIQRLSLAENWQATVKLPLHEKRRIDLMTPDVTQAYIRAQYHYLALRDSLPVEEVEAIQSQQRRCWSCIHFLHRGNGCVFQFPEARQSMGKFAAKCQVYSDGTKNQGKDNVWDGSLD